MSPAPVEAHNTDAFAPPEERAVSRGPSPIPVALVWSMAGAACGVAVGAWAQVLGLQRTVVPSGLGGAVLLFFLGLIAFAIERRAAKSRKELLDGRGRLVRPLAAWLITIPMALGASGFLAFVVVAWLRTGSTTPVLLFVLVMITMLGVSRPVIGSRSLAKAVEALESGRIADAQNRLLAIEAAPWWTRNVRAMAALNLGFLALIQGRLDDAGTWYARANLGKERALARTGLALVRALQDKYAEADEHLTQAGRTGEGRHAQAEIDGVRLLVALRREGPHEARRLGDRLMNPASGGLFLAVLASARSRAGDPAGAREILDEPGAREMVDSGFGDLIPELTALRWDAAGD